MDRIEIVNRVADFRRRVRSFELTSEKETSDELAKIETLVPNTYIGDLIFQIEMEVEEIADEAMSQQNAYNEGGKEGFEQYLFDFALKILDDDKMSKPNKRYAFSLIYRRDKALALEYGHKIWPEEYPAA